MSKNKIIGYSIFGLLFLSFFGIMAWEEGIKTALIILGVAIFGIGLIFFGFYFLFKDD